MKPASISASAAQAFETCPARYKATYIDKTPDYSGAAATGGTNVHAALEAYVLGDHYKTPSLAVLFSLYDAACSASGDRSRYAEGHEMLENWWNRTDLLDGRTILSTEVKEEFPVPTSIGPIPVRYIFDRCDTLADESIEVVDYKTTVLPMQPEDLKRRIQPRLYALAAAIKYRAINPPAIWVTFDLLRYDSIGVKFTHDDNRETWEWLKQLAERIIESDGAEERLNPECRFCVRRGSCKTLLAHAEGGGVLAVNGLHEAADHRAKLNYAKGALDRQIKELDEYILAEAEEAGTLAFKTDQTEVKISARSVREIDSERAAKLLGPEIMKDHGKLPIGAVDELLKNGRLDASTKSELRQLIRKKLSAPSVSTKPLASVGEED